MKITARILEPAELIDVVKSEMTDYESVITFQYQDKKRTRLKVYNIPAAFDIETYSWEEDDGSKYSTLVCWQFGVNGHVCMGRTWNEFIEFLNELKRVMCISHTNQLYVYIHNESYEFQWLRSRLEFNRVFAVSDRQPIVAESDGVCFKDSLVLTGCSLESVELNEYVDIKKQVGKWDYRKARHSGTPLTDDEKKYAIFDVLVVMCLIQEKINMEDDRKITSIPMTMTGYVRRDVRRHTKEVNKAYARLINSLKLDGHMYEALRKAYRGGFTHATHNALKSNGMYDADGHIYLDVDSYDFTSSYPSVIVCEKMPMGVISTEIPKTTEQVVSDIDDYWVLAYVKFKGLREKIKYEHSESASKCWISPDEKDENGNVIVKHSEVDNGRIVWADEMVTWLVGEDFLTMRDFYEWDTCEISEYYKFMKVYLPTCLVERVLYYYELKTKLKGVKGSEVLYALAKCMLNAIYGMMVTRLDRDDSEYDGEWESEKRIRYIKEHHKPMEKKPVDYEAIMEKENKKRSRFLYYAWGVAITSYARRNLMRGIVACGSSYLYSDTDSIKYKKNDTFKEWIDEYNREIEIKMLKAMEYHGFDKDKWRPETIDHKVKPLGYWDFDGHYEAFKTLGAKRYLVMKRDKDTGNLEVIPTVAGCNKKSLQAYLTEENLSMAFKKFTNNLTVPADKSGKLGHFYGGEFEADVTDYLGNTIHVHETTYCALLPISFTVSLAKNYLSYLMGSTEVTYLTN